jgi:hypothetical protein
LIEPGGQRVGMNQKHKTKKYMKKTLLFLVTILALASCQDKVQNKYMGCFPVYTSYEDFREPAPFLAPAPITKNGNIYIKDQSCISE